MTKRRGRPAKLALEEGRHTLTVYRNRRIYSTKERTFVVGWYAMELPRGSFDVVHHETGIDCTEWFLASVRHNEEARRLKAWAKRLGIRP